MSDFWKFLEVFGASWGVLLFFLLLRSVVATSSQKLDGSSTSAEPPGSFR
jgi:hypothetical protein